MPSQENSLRTRSLSWRVLLLLGLAVVLNAADRGNLSTVAPVLGSELGLSHTKLGVLLSAFFWVYAPAQFLAGAAAERFAIKQVIAAGFFLWAMATLLTGFAQGFAMLLALRLALGLGEASLFPAASKLLAERTSQSERGLANAVLLAGLSIGPALGTFLGGKLLAHTGWRPVFWAFGAVSLLWLFPWLATPASETEASPKAGFDTGPGYSEILAKPALWGMALGHFSANYMGYFLLTWLPSFLVHDRHLSLDAMAVTGTIIFAAEACAAIGFGLLGDALIRRGLPAPAVRRAMILTATISIGVFMLGAILAPARFAIPCLVLAAASRGMQLPGMYAIAQTLSGARAGGRWMGAQNALANLAGIVAPIATGMVVDATGSFFWAFALVAAFCAIGALCWAFVIGPIAPIGWREAESGELP